MSSPISSPPDTDSFEDGYVPRNMPPSQLRQLAEFRARQWLMDKDYPCTGNGSFVDAHQLTNVVLEFTAADGTRVIITDRDIPSQAHKALREAASEPESLLPLEEA